jgi:hypothetical protein
VVTWTVVPGTVTGTVAAGVVTVVPVGVVTVVLVGTDAVSVVTGVESVTVGSASLAG